MAKTAYTAISRRPGPVLRVFRAGASPRAARGCCSFTLCASSTSVPDLVHAGGHHQGGNADGGQDEIAPPSPFQDGPVDGGRGQEHGGGEVAPEFPGFTGNGFTG